MLLKIYIYGYLNRIASSRQLERETQRNVELMWLTERLMPDAGNAVGDVTQARLRDRLAMPPRALERKAGAAEHLWLLSPA